jgi:hypothetical protein
MSNSVKDMIVDILRHFLVYVRILDGGLCSAGRALVDILGRLVMPPLVEPWMELEEIGNEQTPMAGPAPRKVYSSWRG